MKPMIALLSAAVLLGMGQTGNAGQKTLPSRYADTAYGFSFQPPAGWTAKTDMPKPIIAYIGPTEQDYASNISVNVFARPVPKSEEKGFLDNVKKEYAKIGKMSPIRQTKLAGQTAYAWSAKLSMPNYPTVVNQQVVCFANQRAYTLTFTTLPTTLKKYTPSFTQFCATFRFTKPTKTEPGK